MSGEITLIDGGDQSVSRLVRTAAALFGRPGFGPAALVGGLAVTVRLGTVHRATNDVDTVSDGEAPGELALRYLGDHDAADAGRIEIDGVKVDVLATAHLPADPAELPDDDAQRLFVLGHRWALESATAVEIKVATADGEVVVPSTGLAVASGQALVACKLHAIGDRRGARAEKRESDAVDLVRLARDLVRSPDLGRRFASAPFDLRALVTAEIEHWFIKDSLRMARLVNADRSKPNGVEPAELVTLGQLFTQRLIA